MIRPDLPYSELAPGVAAALLGLAIPEACLPGVRDAWEALGGHWRNLADFVVPDIAPE